MASSAPRPRDCPTHLVIAFRRQAQDELVAPLSILLGTRDGEAIASDGQPYWKIGHPRNAGIAEQFVKSDPPRDDSAEIILMPIERKFSAGNQGSRKNGSTDRRDLQKQAFGSFEVSDQLTGRESVRIAPVAYRRAIEINVEGSRRN